MIENFSNVSSHLGGVNIAIILLQNYNRLETNKRHYYRVATYILCPFQQFLGQLGRGRLVVPVIFFRIGYMPSNAGWNTAPTDEV